jgi:hypothetical protein
VNGLSPEDASPTPEEAVRGDIPERYVTVLGVRIEGDEATVWTVTNDRPPYELYEEQCVRTADGWYSLGGGNGFGVDTPPGIWAKASDLGAWTLGPATE